MVPGIPDPLIRLASPCTVPAQGFRTVLFAALLLPLLVLGQSRLVISGDAYVRIDDGAWVVVDNPAANAITTGVGGGNIRTEGEFNRVRWQIRDNVGTYVVPFTSLNGVKIPFTYTVLTAGSADPQASVVFSTYNHASPTLPPVAQLWNNDEYRPSDVTHMNSYNAPSVPNSQNAVDRFWIVDPGAGPYAYSAKPSVELGFVYENNASNGEVMPGNFITPLEPVGAQRFNTGAGLWGDMLPMGTWTGGAIGTVTGAAIPAADFFRSWTLANIFEPLPVQLLDAAVACSGGQVVMQWRTGTEQNSAHFVVERSMDGERFLPIGKVPAAGFSHTVQQYRFVDDAPLTLGYYRLRQVDRDGTEVLGDVLASACDGTGFQILNAWDDGAFLNLSMRADEEQSVEVRVLDAAGRAIHAEALQMQHGVHTYALPSARMATGVYMVHVVGRAVAASRKVSLMR